MSTPTAITPARFNDALRSAESLRTKLDKVRTKTEEKVGEVFKAVETVGAALGVGYIRGKYGKIQVGPGVPLEAVIGGACSLAAFIDLPGKHSEHLHNVGNGILATWAGFEAIELAGGVVLSKEDVERLQKQAEAPIEPKETRLFDDVRRMPAREAMGTQQSPVEAEKATA